MPPIQISQYILSRMIEEAFRQPDRECCGLLAGKEGAITVIYPAKNVAGDPAKNYEIAPEDIFRCMREIRDAALEFLGIYHSHPNGKNEPSARDVEQAYYPDVAYFILSPLPQSPDRSASQSARAFSIRDARVTELEIQIL